jgi:phage tail-like protein
MAKSRLPDEREVIGESEVYQGVPSSGTYGRVLGTTADKSVQGVKSKPFPYKGFKFIVFIEGVPVAGFRKVSGLAIEHRFNEIKIGGWDSPLRLYDGISYQDIVLEKGMTKEPYLWNWFICRSVSTPIKALNVLMGVASVRRNILIVLQDRGDVPRVQWVVYQAMPRRIEFSDLDAGSSEVLIQRLVLCHNGFDMVI